MTNQQNKRLGLWAGLAVLVLMLGIGVMASATFAATPSGAPVAGGAASNAAAAAPKEAAAQPKPAAPDACGPGYNYVFTTDTTTFISGTTDINNHTDDGTTTIALPFPVGFYKQAFSNAIVGSNGTLAFTTNGNAFTNICPLPTSTMNNLIAPHWDDQRTDQTGAGCTAFVAPGCGIFTAVLGTAPARRLVIEWRTVYFSPNTTSLNYEVILYEGVDRIDYVYNYVPNGGISASIGLQKGTTGPVTSFSCNVTSLSNNLRIMFTPGPCFTPTVTVTPGGPTLTPTNTFTSTPTPTNTLAPTKTPASCLEGSNFVIEPSAGATMIPGVTDTGNHTDDTTTLIGLPFPYVLYGNVFTNASVGPNGMLDFVGTLGTFTNSCLPNATFNTTIFPHWDDQRTDTQTGCTAFPGGLTTSCGIFTTVLGTSPNRVFVIEWRTVYFGDLTHTANYEVLLYEAPGPNGGEFDVIYGNVFYNGGPHPTSDLGATIGVQKDAGTPLVSQYSCNTASLSAGLRLHFRHIGCGEPTQTPTFSPPTSTPTSTNTPTLTRTPTLTPGGPTLTPTNTPTPTNTSPPTKTPAPCLEGSNYVIEPMSSTLMLGVTDIGNHCDDCVTAITLPFTYVFYGNLFTTANVSSNGNLQFNSSNTTFTNVCLPATSFSATIFPHWDDQNTTAALTGCVGYPGGACGVFTDVQGSFPNRVFIIEWRNVYFSDNTLRANYEIKLYENAGLNGSEFDVIYGEVAQGGSSATVGVQKDSVGVLVSQYSCNAPGSLTTGLKLHFRPIGCGEPTQIPTTGPSNTPTNTGTNTPTPSITPGGPTLTPTNTNTPTATITPVFTLTITPTPCQTLIALNEGFESGTLGAFTTTVITATNTWAAVTTPAPNTGTFSAFVVDISTPSDSRMTLSSPIAVPLNATHATLTFSHKYSFEGTSPSCFDAGVLETSTNGGATWNDAQGLITSGGYTGNVSTGFHNPLAGRAAWCYAIGSYGQVTVDLLPLAGNSVLFRFRQGTDDSLTGVGWNVDDVSVKIGGPCPNANLVGHVTWQGIPQSNPRSILPISLTLKSGATETNYPAQNTDDAGFFTVSVLGLLPGTYDWRVQGPDGPSGLNTTSGFIANCGTVTLTGAPSTSMDNNQVFLPACPLGCIKGGDSNNSNVINASDFNIVKLQFGSAGVNTGDANNDLVVNVSDFNILKGNFGQAGCSGVLSLGEVKGTVPGNK